MRTLEINEEKGRKYETLSRKTEESSEPMLIKIAVILKTFKIKKVTAVLNLKYESKVESQSVNSTHPAVPLANARYMYISSASGTTFYCASGQARVYYKTYTRLQ